MKLFKNLAFFRIAEGFPFDLSAAQEHLAACTFAPCAPTQALSVGFEPPREANGPMVESIGGQWVAKIKTETKQVPAQVINRRIDELSKDIEHHTGRKPGRKLRNELKDQAMLELLPLAFAKQSTALVWIDPTTRTLVVEASSPTKADDAAGAIVKALQGTMGLSLVHTSESPSNCMAAWLTDGIPPEGFSIDRECSLQGTDEQRSVVKYGRHNLDTDNVREHLQQGKVPTSMALTWQGRLSFLLTDGLMLKKVQFLDVVFEGKAGDQQADEFDANMAIATGELSGLIADLLDALGGEVVPGGAA
jgi:recombination associated protein RdgC